MNEYEPVANKLRDSSLRFTFVGSPKGSIQASIGDSVEVPVLSRVNDNKYSLRQALRDE